MPARRCANEISINDDRLLWGEGREVHVINFSISVGSAVFWSRIPRPAMAAAAWRGDLR